MAKKPATPAQTKKDWNKTAKKTPAPKKVATKKANLPAKVTPPPVAEEPIVTPAPVTPPPAPTQTENAVPSVVELVREGETGKRYQSKTDANSKYHLRDRSDVPKPVKVTHDIAEANPSLTRKEVIELAIAAGVNRNTAMTQYSLWKKKANLAPASGIPGLVALDEDGSEVPFEG